MILEHVLSLPRRILGKDKENEQNIRVIIEGRYDEEAGQHSMGAEKYKLPFDITRVKMGKYALDLLAKSDDGGNIRMVYTRQEKVKEIMLEYDASKMSHPRALITEDGRIFYDTNTKTTNVDYWEKRLEDLLKSAAKQYCANFDFEFMKINKND